ncbi:hypothetical protein AKJ45_03740 [candidate division MSBL1 archaeon SCGC-AAA261F19]|uniref:Ribonuclease P protein component 1 n=4 Tax=candidate division MSBL1 TaxID=215777 RepID=A0A133UZN0_9EURY|nr:hypothetical protein AKJ42_02780 [candidate division MSBL1 archaeon SCGC-AAA261C02]KXB02089.1 hypothetical protein AKJ45_03740 [candidate division MSBL1 archaeon SCGC-AAA261F19]KXB04219.1 hypothetical protein AKJ47_00345 [candidate division MSBL1 archaeon SCGC-AAA261G05]KXB09378.1 hypothetical protein AKJ46_00460 [candidate division MSBL1 archaeon SCGC-AAA833K04]
MTKENLLQHEFIGLRAKVIESSDPTLKNKVGMIVDETHNTLILEENEELKTLPKSEVKLSVTLPDGEKVRVNGIRLVARPADRVKKYG